MKPNVKNKAQDHSKALLAWYDLHRREMPWRALAGRRPDPYAVLVSETMLQQTTVATVGPYFVKFMKRWPTLKALAKASPDGVRQVWAGLGYYRRAQNLHSCALRLMEEHNGKFPESESELLKLSGIGPYTAAALMAIAFDRPANVVDGNVERVMARLFAVQTPLPKAKKKLRELAGELAPTKRCGDYAQALMDLGATVCTPRSPKCALCPWRSACAAQRQGIAETLPRRVRPAAAKPVRYGVAFVLFDKKGAVLLEKRPESGLLASMIALPCSPWREGKPLAWAAARRYAPSSAGWRLLSGGVHHTFTHFRLELKVAVATAFLKPKAQRGGRWVAAENLHAEALPSVMRKVLAFAKETKNKGTRE